MPFEGFAESWGAYKLASTSDPDLLNNLKSRWTAVGGSLTVSTSGRNGNGLTIPFSGFISKTLKHSSTFNIGFAFRYNAGPTGNDVIFALNNNDNRLFSLKILSDGTIQALAGTSTSIGVSSRALLVSKFYWIDLEVTLSGSSPIMATAEVRINTHTEITGSASTSLTTAQLISGDATINNFFLSGPAGPGGVGSATYSDFYIKNNSGFYGDIHILPLVPNGDVVSDWTPSTGGVHYVMVNSIPVDLTKYVKTATANNKDIWDWQDCPGFSGTVKFVNLRVLARKDDEGTKSFKIVVGDTGTEAESDEFFVSDLNEEYYEYSSETDPGTGMAWTQAGFNAKRFGIKLIS
jgi:hypothetical protein